MAFRGEMLDTRIFSWPFSFRGMVMLLFEGPASC